MKNKLAIGLSLLLALAVFAGCGTAASSTSAVQSAVSESVSLPASTPAAEPATFRIAGLKGPTTMGMVKLMSDAEAGQTKHTYSVEMFGAADEVTAKLISGEIDVAAIPANLASTLYNKTEGKIQVAAINTLGVLYVLETGDTIQSVADLKGKTVYTTGKGQTPEYVLNYVLTQNGLNPETDLTIEYKSEATEVAAMLQGADNAIAVLPQPYATAVGLQNEKLRTALNLTEEWNKVASDSALVTGVLVARTEFIQQNEAAFAEFLQDYKASIEWVNANTQEAAALVVQYGIVEKEPLAVKALPLCNITYIDGAELQTMLGGYLQVLYDQKPESVGGALPDSGFYYTAA